MDKRTKMMNHNSLDLSFLSDSSSGTQTNASGDLVASENSKLLLENDKKSVSSGVLHRLTHFTKRSRSRFRREFCHDDEDDDGDDNRNNRFHALSRRLHRNTIIKRYLFLFGFVSTLIIFSQLCLSLSNSEPDVEGWERNRTRDTPTYVLPNVNTTILQPATLCRGDSPTLLLIVVFSAPGNFENRQILRETWANTTEFNYSKFATLHAHLNGTYLPIDDANWRNFTIENEKVGSTDIDDASQANFRLRVVFLVGQTENSTIQERIVHESQTYDDMIQESFYDSYYNLTLKSVMMVKWVVNNGCEGKVNFVMKCDDDMFVNVPNLIHFLLGGTIPAMNATLPHYNYRTVRTWLPMNRFKHRENVLVGLLFCRHKPIKNNYNKWFTPPYLFDGEFYPNYLGGSGYVFTMDTAKKLYDASMNIPLLHLEDVYLTGLCAEEAGIKPTSFHLFFDTPHDNICEVIGMITRHEVESSRIKTAYAEIMSSNYTCPAPTHNARIKPIREPEQCA